MPGPDATLSNWPTFEKPAIKVTKERCPVVRDILGRPTRCALPAGHESEQDHF